LYLLSDVEVTAGSIMIVSCNQDEDIAKLLSESLQAPYLIIECGKFTQEVKNEIRKINPERLIIIGGRFAVPYDAEKLGIRYERIGGKNRIETAQNVLNRFFNFSIQESYILPSTSEVQNFLINSKASKLHVFIGNSSVSHRWGAYYTKRLEDYFQTIISHEESSLNRPALLIGNTENNGIIKNYWNITGLPEAASMLPLVYLKDDILFITGTDQNIFFNQRAFEKIEPREYNIRELLVFFILLVGILAFLTFFLKQYEKMLISGIILGFTLFYLYYIPPKGQLIWDSLYLYFDGAISLLFNGKYETILTGRGLPGTSFLTYLYFLLSGPSDINANLLILLLSIFILSATYIITYRMFGRKAAITALILLLSNPLFNKQTLLYSSDIPFTALTLATILTIIFKSKYSPLASGIFLGFSMLIRPSAAILIPLLLYHYKSVKEKISLLISIPLFIVGIQTLGGVSGYLTELTVKSPIITAYTLDYIKSFFQETGILAAPLLLIGMYKYRNILSQYTLLHLVALLFWVTYDTRYILPIIPFAAMLQSSIFSLTKTKFLIVLVIATIILNIAGLKIIFLS